MIYHGTHTIAAINIARTGAILSPLEQQINVLKDVKKIYLDKAFPNKTIKEAAIDILSGLYSQNEFEHRVKCLKVSPDKKSAINRNNYNKNMIRVALGIEVNGKINEMLPAEWEKENSLFIPKRLSLETLKEVYMHPLISEEFETGIRQAYEKYNPKYSFFQTR